MAVYIGRISFSAEFARLTQAVTDIPYPLGRRQIATVAKEAVVRLAVRVL